MRPGCLLVLAALVACEPPPEAAGGGAPTANILYPPPDIGEVPLIIDGTDEVLEVLVVVEFDNYEFVHPDEAPAEDEEDRGHWHLFVNNVYIGPPATAQALTYTSEPNEFSSGAGIAITAQLASHNHTVLTNSEASSTVEFVVGDPL